MKSIEFRDIYQVKKNDQKKRSESLTRAIKDADEIMRGKFDIDPQHIQNEIKATAEGNKPAALMGVVRNMPPESLELQRQNDAMRSRAKAAGLVEVINWDFPKAGQIVFVKPGNEHIAEAILDPNTSHRDRGILLGFGFHSKDFKPK